MKQRSQPLSKTVFSSLHGTVRVYTRRHINGCLFTNPDQQTCPCPKWLYLRARGEKYRQKAAGTPSFTEACDVAQKWLKGLDPEIRAARELTAPTRPQGITVEAALERYFAILLQRKRSPNYMESTIYSVFRRRRIDLKHHRGARRLNMAFLDFIDERAGVLGRPVRLEEVNGAMLDQWVSGWKSNDLSSKQWRDVAKGFFKWAHERELVPRVPTFDKGQTLRKGNRCGHFEDDQYARLIQTLPFYRSQRVPENFAARMRAFIELGRWAGMAITDIIHFDPARMLDAENVIRYQRRKTKEWAEVALYPDVAARLRSIPPEPGSLPNQPLRFSGRAEHTTEELWRLRFRKICFQAGIREVVTEHGEVRKPHTHMLRDTCAIDAISHGTDLSNVARMLGHKNIQITQRNYLYWITKRSKFCLEDQRASLARRMQVAIDSGAPDVVLAGRPPLVH